jgi:hypothetical protein
VGSEMCIRDRRMGVAPSIMDYARFNYVAQPEDKGAGLMPLIGPYDYWSIEYGYHPIRRTSSPEEERTVLNEWIKAKASNPVYHFGRQAGDPYDPRAQTEDIGSDAVYASEMGLANLQRMVPNLIAWTTLPAEGYDDLSELYGQVIGQLNRYLGHVSTVIGGVYETRKTADQAGPIFVPVEKSYQQRAVDFINRSIFDSPTWLLNNDVLQRIGMSGGIERINNLQRQTLGRLFAESRMGRLQEAAALYGNQAYSLQHLFNDTRGNIFREIDSKTAVELLRRNLQRAYTAKMIELLNAKDTRSSQSDVRAQARRTLEQILRSCKSYSNKDEASAAHAADLRATIEAALQAE